MSPLGETRSAGVLLHISSLPGAYGIGDLGRKAYDFIDLLARAGFGWWQLLPLNMPDGSDSPYSACSAFAGNIFLISPDDLAKEGLLTRRELKSAEAAEGPVAFARMRARKGRLLNLAADRFLASPRGRLGDDYKAFCRAERHWLEDFALFVSIRHAQPWRSWPAELAHRQADAMRRARRELSDEIERVRVLQFLFFRQLAALRAHARRRSVRMLGDVPIYVSMQSADVWANPDLFELDRSLAPKSVAGVPPDAFSRTGQLWGNPLYNWKAMQRQGFEWWRQRVRAALAQADVIRIDHFRGLASYWSVPASHRTAMRGKWIKAPGRELLQSLRDTFDTLPLVAEDLGVITPDVVELREAFGLPGMKILQFAFGDPEGPELPHTYVRDLIAYTGNHDNDTTLGWYRSLGAKERGRVDAYIATNRADPVLSIARHLWGSVARLTIVPMQDVLRLDSRGRMNIPGSEENNWRWRLRADQMRSGVMDDFASLNAVYGRRAAPRMTK